MGPFGGPKPLHPASFPVKTTGRSAGVYILDSRQYLPGTITGSIYSFFLYIYGHLKVLLSSWIGFLHIYGRVSASEFVDWFFTLYPGVFVSVNSILGLVF